MKPTIDQMQAFVALADCGQFTRAAERLGLSQSSVSGAIQKLEAVLGVRLFDRHTRGCRLSAAGESLLPIARRLTEGLDELADSAKSFAQFGGGRLAVAAPTVQCALTLPPILRAFASERPDVRISLHDVAEEKVHELVRFGAVDFGIATQTGERRELSAAAFATDQYLLALPQGHPLTRRSSVEWRQLVGVPVIGPLEGNPVRRHLDAQLADRGIRLDYRFEVSLPWTMVGLVREGFGVAILTTAVRPLIAWHGLEVRPMVRPVITRTLALWSAPGKSLSAPAAAFRRLLTGAATRPRQA